MSTLDPGLASMLLLAMMLCLVLVAANLREDTEPRYREGCNECAAAKRGQDDAEQARRQEEINLIREEREKRKRETQDDDSFRWH